MIRLFYPVCILQLSICTLDWVNLKSLIQSCTSLCTVHLYSCVQNSTSLQLCPVLQYTSTAVYSKVHLYSCVQCCTSLDLCTALYIPLVYNCKVVLVPEVIDILRIVDYQNTTYV